MTDVKKRYTGWPSVPRGERSIQREAKRKTDIPWFLRLLLRENHKSLVLRTETQPTEILDTINSDREKLTLQSIRQLPRSGCKEISLHKTPTHPPRETQRIPPKYLSPAVKSWSRGRAAPCPSPGGLSPAQFGKGASEVPRQRGSVSAGLCAMAPL